MHRDQLLALLLPYQTAYPEEVGTISRFIAFIKSNKSCFERELLAGHITGSAWIIHPDRTKILLTHHRKLKKWLQLGGHAEGQSDILSVALREAFEESGLEKIVPLTQTIFDIDIHLIPKRDKIPSHYHYDVRFAFQSMGSEKFKVSGESLDLSWIKISRLEETTSEASILRMKKKWLNRIS